MNDTYPVNDRQLAIALLALGHNPIKTEGMGFMTIHFPPSAVDDATQVLRGDDVQAPLHKWIYADNLWNMHLNQWRIRREATL